MIWIDSYSVSDSIWLLLKCTHTVHTQTYGYTHMLHTVWISMLTCVHGLILHGCTLSGQTHTFQTDSSANDVFAPSSSCPPSVIIPGVSTTTTFPCWKPPERSRACRSSRKCRSLREPQQWRIPVQSSKETSKRSHRPAFVMTLRGIFRPNY